MTTVRSNEALTGIDVGIVVVHYHNPAQVLGFIRHISGISMPEGRRRIVVVNNGGELHPEFAQTEEVILVDPDANLGYLNGCSRGIIAFRERFEEHPEWWIVSNTDLCVGPSFFECLFQESWPDTVGVLAPDIREDGEWPCNPYLSQRPSPEWIRRRRQIFSTPFFSVPYRYASWAYRKWGQPSPIPSDPQRIYAPHGSLMILSRQFFHRSGQLSYGGFLYGEEIHIAEQMKRCDLDVWWAPSLRARHEANETTGKISAGRRREFAQESLDFLYRTYFQD